MSKEDPRAVAQRGVLLLSEIFALGIPIMYGGFPVSGVSSQSQHTATRATSSESSIHTTKSTPSFH
jgi:hypothetical protein